MEELDGAREVDIMVVEVASDGEEAMASWRVSEKEDDPGRRRCG